MSPWAPCVMLNEEVSLRRTMRRHLRLSAWEISDSPTRLPHFPTPVRQWPPGCGLCCPSPGTDFTVICQRVPSQQPGTQECSSCARTTLSKCHHLRGPHSAGCRAQWKSDDNFRASGMGCVPLLLKGSLVGVALCTHSDWWQTWASLFYTPVSPLGLAPFQPSSLSHTQLPAGCTVRTQYSQMPN